ncbi:hypothetical protein Dimus_003937 [Dionaea muscipula]
MGESFEGSEALIADGVEVAAKEIGGPDEGARRDSPAAAAEASDSRQDEERVAGVFTAQVCTSSYALLMEEMTGGVSPLGYTAGGQAAAGVRAGVFPGRRRMPGMAGGYESCGRAVAAEGED